jgi:hypothetical protein
MRSVSIQIDKQHSIGHGDRIAIGLPERVPIFEEEYLERSALETCEQATLLEHVESQSASTGSRTSRLGTPFRRRINFGHLNSRRRAATRVTKRSDPLKPARQPQALHYGSCVNV